MVLERESQRLAVECDGEQHHLDEHGQLKIEDLERQAILERAGWDVLRIPYRRWQERQEQQLGRIEDWFANALFDDDDCGDDERGQPDPPDVPAPKPTGHAVPVTPHGEAIIQALRAGIHEETQVFRSCLPPLGYQKLGNRIRSELGEAGHQLQRAGLIAIEEEEYFLTAQGREAQTFVAKVQTYRRRHGVASDYRFSPTRRSNVTRAVRHPITCSRCGRSATVPFPPRAGQPVYCLICYRAGRR